MNIDGARSALIINPPNKVEYSLSREQFTPMCHEELQQVIFSWRQCCIYRRAIAGTETPGQKARHVEFLGNRKALRVSDRERRAPVYRARDRTFMVFASSLVISGNS